MRCEHGIEEEVGIDVEAFSLRAPHLLTKKSVETARHMLRRDDEVAAVNKKGRHREADTQMKAFADKFGYSLTVSLPSLSNQHTEARPRLLGPKMHPRRLAINRQCGTL